MYLCNFVSYLSSPRNIGLIVLSVLIWREFRNGKRQV
jgi:hypothetical protein